MLSNIKKIVLNSKSTNFCCYEWSDRIIKRGKQYFAIFGDIAYDVTKLKYTVDNAPRGTGRICIPIKGQYFAQLPDEGRGGILGAYVLKRNGKTKICYSFMNCGWLYTEELKLINREIETNLVIDILNGDNVLTKKPTGRI